MIEIQKMFEKTSQLFQEAGLAMGPAEAHGLVCGLISGGVTEDRILWTELAASGLDVDSKDSEACKAVIGQLVDHTRAQFSSGEGRLELMLPPDTQPVADRALGVKSWVEGFLYGFGLAGKQAASVMSQDAGEALRDFAEISRMDTSDLQDVPETEDALLQLEEFLWVASLLIWHDVTSASGGDK